MPRETYRTATITNRWTPEEVAEITAAAKAARMSRSEYIRDAALEKARKKET